MSRLWRQLGAPGENSPRPNRQSNTAQLGAPYYPPTSGSGSTQRINVIRPSHTGGFTKDPYGYGTRESSRSQSPAHSSRGFWMTSPNKEHDEPVLPAAVAYPYHDVNNRSSSNSSYMTFDDNMFIFKYSSDGDDHTHRDKSRSRTKSSGSKTSGSRKEEDKSVTQDFFQETGFDGLKHAGNSSLPYLMRLLWTVIVCLALAGLLYQVIKSIKKYSEFPINTKYTVDDVKYLDFPAVTVCNINLFRSDKLSSLVGGFDNLTDSGLPQLRQMFPQMGIGDNVWEKTDLPDHYPGNLDLRRFVVETSHRLEDMLVKCAFNDEPCDASNFTRILTNYGVCYTYNSAMDESLVEEVNQAGQRRGLSLILNSQQKLYVAAPRESVGFKILAHAPNEKPPNMDDRGKEIQPGTHVALGLEVRKIKKLDRPYGNCEARKSYTSDKCFLDCQTKYVEDNCGCVTFYMRGEAPFCSPHKLVECVHKTIDEFNYCRQELCSHCRPACQQVHYKGSLSQSSFPSYAVPYVLESNKEYTFPALAFGDLVSYFAMQHMDELSDHIGPGIREVIASLQNSKGVTFLEFTSSSTVNHVADLMSDDIFYNIPYDIFDSMADRLFYDVYPYLEASKYEDLARGSDFYWEEVDNSFDQYVESDLLWYLLEEELDDGTAANVDDAYVDYVYDQFGFEDMFYEAFNISYDSVYGLMKYVAVNQTLPNLDLVSVTTEYMRLNLVHVDVFYEQLEQETIEEQAAYELFQMICDVGGALGLFFGASLLSFIEVFTFCSTRKNRSN